MAEYTKGEWKIQKDGDGFVEYIYSEKTTQWICGLTKQLPPITPYEEWLRREANARLIAAAPDLLAACNISDDLLRSLLDSKTDFDDEQRIEIDEVLGEIQLAISKAKF